MFQSFAKVTTGEDVAGAFLDSAVNTNTLTTFTFPSVALGTGPRKLVIAISSAFSSRVGAVSVTADGESLTFAMAMTDGTSDEFEIWYLDNPTGASTGDVVVTWGGALPDTGIAVWTITGARNGAPFNTGQVQGSGTSVQVNTVNVPRHGLILAGCITRFNGNALHDWIIAGDGLDTEGYDQSITTNVTNMSGAFQVVSRGATNYDVIVTASSSTIRLGMGVVSWGPV